MRKAYFIYVSVSSSFYTLAKDLIVQYGWQVRGATEGPWLVFNVLSGMAYYTYQPPNSKDSSVIVADSMATFIANVSPKPRPTPAPTPAPTPVPGDPYKGKMVIVY